MAESTLTRICWTPTRKVAAVLDLLRGGDALGLARRHGLSQAHLFLWRDRFLEGGQAALKARRGQVELDRDRRVRELERTVGQLTVEKEMPKTPDEPNRQRGRRSNG